MYINTTASGSEQKTQTKQCQYPNCNVFFLGKGKTKFCETHKQKKYHKELYFNKYKEQKANNPDINNQIINHNHSIATVRIYNCSHCNKPFNITLYPTVNIYPKYCEEHRNEHKRIIKV